MSLLIKDTIEAGASSRTSHAGLDPRIFTSQSPGSTEPSAKKSDPPIPQTTQGAKPKELTDEQKDAITRARIQQELKRRQKRRLFAETEFNL